MKNYYEILGVSPSSEIEVITAAYKAMMRKYHPDTNGSPQAAERAKEINEAYEVLKNPLRRREYDAKMDHADSPTAQSPAAPPPPPPPPTTSTQVSEPNSGGEKTPFIGERGELRVWTIFAAAYVAIALLYFGPTRISVSIGRSPLDLAAEIAGAALLPFGLGFGISWLWRAFSSSTSEPKTDRKRWLAIQFVFIAILVFNKSMLEKARYDEAAATTSAAALSEYSANCYSAAEQQKWADAATPCLKAAEGNDAKAQYILAKMYMVGNGVKESYELSKSWYLKSADLGFPESQLAVGVGYSTGALTKDGKEDNVQAAIWIRKAAEQGVAEAQLFLASMYEDGVGVEKNLNEAKRWTEAAARQGNEEAKKRLTQWKSEVDTTSSRAAIPANFTGEWNEDLATCGSALNDSKLVISPDQLSFYESDGFVKSVRLNNPRSVTVSANYTGEGQNWTKTITLNLSRSERELTIDGYTRYKCP